MTLVVLMLLLLSSLVQGFQPASSPLHRLNYNPSKGSDRYYRMQLLKSKQTTTKHMTALAAKKKAKKKGVVGKGFGVSSQPKIEDIVAKFQTRMPENAEKAACPCGSGLNYEECCMPFHRKEKTCTSPLDVLRSRYTAFAWRLPLYVIDTTHPVCRDYRKDKVTWVKDLNRAGMFDSYNFMGLEVGEEQIEDKEGFIDFKVKLQANDKSEQYSEGESITVCENSRFLQTDGVWKYAGGDVRSEVAGIEDVVLNS